MSNMHARLWYSIGNEDWQTEQKALKIEPDSRILCVTASGDRPLNLLSSPCKEIMAIDANPFQNALFDLKKVAMQNLSYEEYLSFLGLLPHPNRLQTYYSFEKKLAPSSALLWNKRLKMINGGVIYQGTLERLLSRVSVIFRMLRGKKIERLFDFDDLDEQRVFLHNEWKTPLLRKAFNLALHPVFARKFIKDPGMYEHVDPASQAGNQLFERLHSALEGFLAKESLLLNLFFKGKINPSIFPPYLKEEGVATIKPRLDALHFETLDLISFLEKSEDNSFDRFSVSDVASYLSKEEYHCMLKEIYRTAKPNARFCIRQFLSSYPMPEPYASVMERDYELEKTLDKEDRCCVYRFMVGTIRK